MDQQRAAELAREADEIKASDPSHFEQERYNQPQGHWVSEAEGLLPDGAPWHQVAHVAHALDQEDRDQDDANMAARKGSTTP